MFARIVMVVAFALFTAVWVYCQTEDELKTMRGCVFKNHDQWKPAVVYIDQIDYKGRN